jgi:phosphatidylserine/phosphatidylglycerophosphate/cardiolipin synthase-like enzyme
VSPARPAVPPEPRRRILRAVLRLVAVVGLGLPLAACAVLGRGPGFSDRSVARESSTGALPLWYARLLTGNDAAFHSKLQMIEEAKTSIDAMYYIYQDDFSSSVLSEALLAAARRGVRVRLLLDYHFNYAKLDLFSMLEGEAAGARGSLEVRFFNRPTRNIVMDAAYLTLGCAEAAARAPDRSCSAAKLAEIARLFEAEQVDGRPAAELGVSNLNVGLSGLFLSGLYSKNPDLVALAVLEGQSLDAATLARAAAAGVAPDREALTAAARLHLAARGRDPFRQLTARIQLSAGSLLYGDPFPAVREALAPFFPPDRRLGDEGTRDWEYLTDFLHHKLLLVDGDRLQLGGRNIEDSYHMRPNPLVDKYIFMDTDLWARVREGGERLGASFDALWNFRRMVASIAEVRAHAPNDVAANARAQAQAERACRAGEARAREACLARELAGRIGTQAEREASHRAAMRERAQRYWREYRYASVPDPSPSLWVDAEALAAYVENVPFAGDPARQERAYGAENGRESRSGKHLHALWVAGLEDTCRRGATEGPQRVILHNAYFFVPSNLMTTFGRMVDGRLPCPNVTVTVLTNSVESTDLFPVNILAGHAMLAFAEHYRARRDPKQGATFRFHEYRRVREEDRLSLHTKVSVLGDSVIVGSANADVRSYMMDSNNGMLIRHAPVFVTRYVAELDRMMAAGQLVQDVTERVLTITREQLLAADRRIVRAALDGPGEDGARVESAQLFAIEARLWERLDLVYGLTRTMLAGGRQGRAAEAEFNRLFKPI